MDQILEEIKKLKENTDDKTKKKFELELTEKIVMRLVSFSDCRECVEFKNEFEYYIREIFINPQMKVNKGYLDLVRRVKEHLQKKHKLVPDGYYSSTYLAIGVSLGTAFGLIFSKAIGQTAYLGVGLPIGVAIGVAIGSQKDKQAKKDGLVI